MLKKEIGRLKRHRRLRKRILGTPERPRLALHRSSKNLVAQIIDDLNQKTLLGISTLSKEFRDKIKSGGTEKSAALFGEMVANLAKGKGFSKIVFDRGGYLYHGRVKAFADAARKGGLEF